MTIDTQHPEIALQMRWAHKALGTWEAVAKLCGDNPRTGLPVKSALAWWFVIPVLVFTLAIRRQP